MAMKALQPDDSWESTLVTASRNTLAEMADDYLDAIADGADGAAYTAKLKAISRELDRRERIERR